MRSWFRTSRMIAVTLTATVAAGCSGGGGEGSSSSGPVPTGLPSSEVPTTEVEPTTPVTEAVPAPPDVPAGVNWVAVDAPAGETSSVPTFDEITATAGVPPAPAGYPFRQSTYTAQRWDVAGVSLVSAGCSCWEGGGSSGVFGRLANQPYLFRSDNGGSSWSKVDLGAALGVGNGYLDDIIEFDGVLLLQASLSDDSRTRPSVIVVARSTDGGVTWERVATLAGEYDGRLSLFGGHFGVVGGNLVLVGADVVCDFDGSASVQSIGTSLQPRLWTSTDGGVTWAAQGRSDTVLDTKPAAPADQAGCEGLDLADRQEQFSVRPRAIEFAGDRVFVWSADGERMATSTDGLTWATATLDGALPLPGEFAEPELSSYAATVYDSDGTFVAVNLEARRSAADEATGSSSAASIVVWVSSDGATWERQPLGRPLRMDDLGGRFDLSPTAAGLGLVEFDYQDGEPVVLQSWESIAGPFERWTTCEADAGVNCSFAEEVVGIEPGDDLSGIHLDDVMLADVDLTGVSFRGASFNAAGIIDCVLDGTDFTAADLSFVSLNGVTTTTVFDGAVLHNAFVDGSFFNADVSGAVISRLRVAIDVEPLPPGISFAGQDLTDWSFNGYSARGDLTGLDFSGATLSGTSFSGVDLTGADFSGADLSSVYFSTFGDFPIVCPDGLPPDDSQSGPEACRLVSG